MVSTAPYVKTEGRKFETFVSDDGEKIQIYYDKDRRYFNACPGDGKTYMSSDIADLHEAIAVALTRRNSADREWHKMIYVSVWQLYNGKSWSYTVEEREFASANGNKAYMRTSDGEVTEIYILAGKNFDPQERMICLEDEHSTALFPVEMINTKDAIWTLNLITDCMYAIGEALEAVGGKRWLESIATMSAGLPKIVDQLYKKGE